MIIIHGENTVQSRKKLVELIEEAKAKNTLIERLEADKLTVPTLESKLQKTDLFGHSRLIVIEGLHSLRRSNQKKELIQLIANAQMDLILWEKRALTKTMLKKIQPDNEAQVFEYKVSNTLFSWLDTLSPNERTKQKQLSAFKAAIQDNDAYMCLIMLARQVRLLIQAQTGGKIKGPGFVVNKIKKQSQAFSLDQLLSLHEQLYELDTAMKTSTNILEIDQHLEHIIINL